MRKLFCQSFFVPTKKCLLCQFFSMTRTLVEMLAYQLLNKCTYHREKNCQSCAQIRIKILLQITCFSAGLTGFNIFNRERCVCRKKLVIVKILSIGLYSFVLINLTVKTHPPTTTVVYAKCLHVLSLSNPESKTCLRESVISQTL